MRVRSGTFFSCSGTFKEVQIETWMMCFQGEVGTGSFNQPQLLRPLENATTHSDNLAAEAAAHHDCHRKGNETPLNRTGCIKKG